MNKSCLALPGFWHIGSGRYEQILHLRIDEDLNRAESALT